MKPEYDLSEGERGKFFRTGATLLTPLVNDIIQEHISMPTTLDQKTVELECENTDMGKVVVELELFNSDDEGLCANGMLTPAKIRHTKLEALVDMGSTLLSLPQEDIDKIGLRFYRESISKFAKGQKAVRKIYGPVTIKVMGRIDSVLALAGHSGMPALLGQIPLEGLDLMVDSKRQRLIPGHPDFPNDQVVDMY